MSKPYDPKRWAAFEVVGGRLNWYWRRTDPPGPILHGPYLFRRNAFRDGRKQTGGRGRISGAPTVPTRFYS